MESIQYFQTISPSAELRSLQIGTAQAVVAPIERLPVPKTARKITDLLITLQRNGVLSSGLVINATALQYTTSGVGDPGFTFIHVENGEKGGLFLHPRLMSIRKEGVIADPVQVFRDVEFSHGVQILSGCCLFGVNSAYGVSENGEPVFMSDHDSLQAIKSPIVDFMVNDKVHPYEAETIARLSESLRYIAPSASRSIYFHLPELEYQGYGLELYRKGLLSEDLLRKWFIHVHQRVQGLAQLISRRVNAPIEFVAPLAVVKEKIEDDVHTIHLAEIVQSLYDHDKSWRFLLSRSSEPRDFIALNQMSYQAAYLQRAINGSPTIIIENPNEVRIWDSVREVLKNNYKGWVECTGVSSHFIGVYVHPNMVLSPDGGYHGKSYMYYTKAEPGLVSLREVMRDFRKK